MFFDDFGLPAWVPGHPRSHPWVLDVANLAPSCPGEPPGTLKSCSRVHFSRKNWVSLEKRRDSTTLGFKNKLLARKIDRELTSLSKK